jgi:hypothetical protein
VIVQLKNGNSNGAVVLGGQDGEAEYQVQIERQYQVNLARSRMKKVEENRNLLAFSLETIDLQVQDMISVRKEGSIERSDARLSF